MLQSAKRISSQNADKVVSTKWTPAANNTAAFIQEAKKMQRATNKGIPLYNKIASPGFKYWGRPWNR